MIFLGVDPGVNGTMTIITSKRQWVMTISFSGLSTMQISRYLDLSDYDDEAFCVLERVHAMPSKFRGSSSSWELAESFSMLKTILTLRGVPFSQVLPERWQKELKLPAKGDKTYDAHKKVLHQRAQALYPKANLLKGTADSLLIAEYARRTFK